MPIKSWFPIADESGNFKEESGWNVILKQIYTVLMTPIGTRQWQPEFGSHLQEYLFAHSDSKDEISNDVRQSFKWLPHVTLISCDVTIESLTSRSGVSAKIDLVVEYENEQLPIGLVIPSNLDSLDGTIYDIGLRS